MQCIRCGREIPAGQVFCRDCLDEMARCPVKPGTPVQLPVRPTEQPPRRHPPRRSRPQRKPEEQIALLTARLRRLYLALAVAVVVAALAMTALIWTVTSRDEAPQPPVPGETTVWDIAVEDCFT